LAARGVYEMGDTEMDEGGTEAVWEEGGMPRRGGVHEPSAYYSSRRRYF